MAADEANANDAANEAKKPADWKKRESFGSAFVQIIVVAAVLGGAVYFVWGRSNTRRQIDEKLKEIHTAQARDNVSDLEKALKGTEDVLKLDGNSAKALGIAAGLHTELWLDYRIPGHEEKAKDFLARAEKADSTTEERYASHAQILLKDGKAKEADEYVEELRKKGASSPRLFYAQAQAIAAEGNLKLAKSGYSSAMDKAWKDPLYASAYGEALLTEGIWFQAADAFGKGISANPDHTRSILGLALTRALKHDKLKDASDALDAVEKSGDLAPGLKVRLLVARAELANVEARYDDAIKTADDAIAIDADNAWPYYVKARALGLKKDDKAVEAFNTAVAKNKTAPLFYFDGAGLLQQMNKLDEALALLAVYEKNFAQVKNLASDGKEEIYLDRDDRYWIAKGDVLKAANKLDDALVAYQKAVDAKSIYQAKAIYSKASISMARKKYDEAAEILEPIVPPDGSGPSAEAYLVAGDLQFEKKEYPQGCQFYAFALTNMKQHQVDREKMNGIVDDVEKKLKVAGQNNIAKAWKEEAGKLIQ